MKSFHVSLSLATLFLLIFPLIFKAQDLDDVTISGRITDVSGATLPGAIVKVTLTRTGAARTVVTDPDGLFRIIELMPGTYEMHVSSEGFADARLLTAELLAGTSFKRDISLAPADVVVTQDVYIDGSNQPLVDPTKTINGGSLSELEVSELPNSSDDVLDLVFALSGIAEEPFAIRDLAGDDRIGGGSERDRPSEVTGAGNFSLSGGAAYSTNITIDGLDNNDDREAEERFQPPADAVAEVQVVTNQFSAEYGRASGGRINIRTRGGTRKLRGSLKFRFEDESLNANTYNNNRRGLGRLPYSRFSPGGTLQGPLPIPRYGGRTYFFSSFSTDYRSATTLIDTMLPADRNLSYPLPAPTHPREARVDDIPNPSTDTFPAVDIAPYRKVIDAPSRKDRFVQRIDHRFNDGHSVTLNFQFGRIRDFRQYRETSRFLEETVQGRIRRTDAFYLTDNLVIGDRMVNQLRFQFSDYRPSFAARGTEAPVVLLFISDDSRAGSDDQVRGTVVIGNSTANFASLRLERRLQVQESLTRVEGAHTVRLGIDIQTIRSENRDLRDATGTFNFARVYDFLTNQPSRYRRNFGADSTQKNSYYALFFQDEWRPTEGTTLSYGLRYERETILKDKNNYGPRIAIAWSPGSRGRTVVRAGAGIFYNRTLLRTLDDYSLGASTVRFDSEALAGPSNERRCLNQRVPGPNALTDKCRFLAAIGARFPLAPSLQDLNEVLAGLAITDGGFVTETNFSRLVQKGIRIPESYQFNIGFERDLGAGFAFGADLSFNKAVRLWRETNINAYRPPQGFATLTDYLLSLGTIDLGGSPTRFEIGDPYDNDGVRNEDGVRIVNLATRNGSEARSAPIGIAFDALGATLVRPYDDSLGQVELVSSIGTSVYEGFSFFLRRRTGRLPGGFSAYFRLHYDLARVRDDGFVDTSSAQVAGDFRSEFSSSTIDRRHKLRISGSIEAPKWLGKIRMSTIIRAESARPFNITIGGSDRNLDDVGNDRPNFNGDPGSIVSRRPGERFPQPLADSFSLAPIGSPGNLGRNAGRGPSLYMFDAAFSRDFRLTERIKLRTRINFDNILNSTVYSFGSDFIDLSESGTAEFARGFLVPGRTLAQRKVSLRFSIEL